jgi:Ca2+-binding RTX toxin-like protein
MAIKTGNDSSEQLDGTSAYDQLFGHGGDDLLLGNDGNDYLSGDDGNDELRGGNGNDILEGGNGNDRYTGGAGQDTFIINLENTAANNDISDFEPGTDRIDLSKLRIADFATIQAILGDAGAGNSGFGFYRNDAWLSTVMLGVVKDDLFASDFVFSTAVSNDTETGGSLKDYLFGGLGNDTLSGGLGDDRLFGEGGNDTLYGNTAATPNGTADGIDLLYGGSGNDQLFGGSQNDQLFGGDGNDRLDGGTDSDFMTGGAGIDTFVMRAENSYQNDSITDFDVTQDKLDVSALGISEFDTIKALNGNSTTGDMGIFYHVNGNDALLFLNGILPGSLSASNIYFSTSTTDSTLTGDTQANDLFGGLGNDKLSGGLGNDRLFGEQGDDQLFGNDKANPAGSISDGRDLLYGGAGNDQLSGGGDNDTLKGGSGNDILTGGTGNDTLDGGSGLDTASYLASTSAITVRLWDNTASGGDASGDTLISIENITGSTLGNDVLIGNALDNVLDGSGGADSMNGREGNDTYFVDNAGDSISDRSGYDTVNSTLSYTLGATLENLTLSGTGALKGTGNALSNTLSGNAGNNILNGLDGIDTVSYANALAGVTVNLATSSAQNTIGAGLDTLLNFENLTGSAFNDTLQGNSSANLLKGGAGADKLTGGTGTDTFVFNSKTGSDTITDFLSATDKLKFSQSAIRIGDGDLLVEGGVVRASGSGGFANSAELVIMQQNIAGTINTSSAASIIGSATAAYALGKTALFAVDNGTTTGLFLFTAANTDALVSAGELTQLGIIGNTATTALADYGFIA